MKCSFLKSGFVICCLLSYTAFAQMPKLIVPETGEPVDHNPVILESLKIDVKIIGSIANTKMTMTFYNKSTRILEGNLTFPLPEAANVTRYAIDINGRLREAVPVEKAKGTSVFESIEHRKVDPGLLEKVEGNNFRTRIYPLPANGTRTVMITYQQELKADASRALQYHLPLSYIDIIRDFHLKVTVYKTMLKPELEEQPDNSFSFKNAGDIYEAEMRRGNYVASRSLTINLPKNSNVPETMMQPAGDSYYFLVNTYVNEQGRNRAWADRIGIIWDVSLSGMHRDIKKEMELLDHIIRQKQNLRIELGLLNYKFVHGGSFNVVNGNWQQLRTALEKVVYDGGTDFQKINNILLNVDEYLFFTDGLSTFGNSTVSLQKPVHCISTAAKADYNILNDISSTTAGQFINLSEMSVDAASQLLSKENLQFLGIKNNSNVSEVFPAPHTTVALNISVAGIAASSTEIILQFGFGNHVTLEKRIMLKPDTGTTILDIAGIWAQKKIDALDIRYPQNKEEITDLGKQFGIVTRNTSLIVLEAVEDYVRYEIAPPDELRAEFNRLVKEQSVAKEERVNDLLTQAFSMKEALRKWWKQSFVLKKAYPRPGRNAVPGTTSAVANRDVFEPPTMPSAVAIHHLNFTAAKSAGDDETKSESAGKSFFTATDTVVAGMYNTDYRSADLESIVVSEKRKAAWGNDPSAIEIPEFKSDNAYMKKFAGINSANAYVTYLSLRPGYISTPLFYYDVADWFYKHNNKDTALLILSSIADLDLENAELYKLLAYKLKEIGSHEAEIFVTKKILDWRPMDAQSFRDYGLALADAGKYQQALDTLYSVLLQSYSPEAADRDDGIEEIIITEINNLISLHGDKLNIGKIDRKLISAIPVEVRVVLNWNKNETDIDLWVTDPSGEKCFYGNNLSAAGGRISNDFTAGFGPEQFMLKKALKGKYKIEINYFGDTQVSLTGPATVMAEIYTNYSNGRQRRKIITLQMPKEQAEGVLVGTFSF